MDKKVATTQAHGTTMGQALADWVAQVVRSWAFVICQAIFIAGWIAWVHIHPATIIDDHAYDILRLILTIEGSFIGSLLLMNQHHQSEKDRRIIYNDYILDHRIYKEVRDLRVILDDMRKDKDETHLDH